MGIQLRRPALPEGHCGDHSGRASKHTLALASLSTLGCLPGNDALTFFPSSQVLFYFSMVNEHPEVLLPISASSFIHFIQQVFIKGLLCAMRGKGRRHSQLLGLGAEQQREWWSTNTGSWMQEPWSLGERTGWREHSGSQLGTTGSQSLPRDSFTTSVQVLNPKKEDLTLTWMALS